MKMFLMIFLINLFSSENLLFPMFIFMLFLMNYWYLNLMFIHMIMFMLMIFMYTYIFIPYSMCFSDLYKSNNQTKMYMITIISCMYFFLTKSSLMMFLSFEVSIIPMFFLLMKFGITERKILASSYLMIYTMIFSMIFLSMIFLISNSYYTFFMSYFSMMYIQPFIALIMSLMFLVKIHMFLIHIWLPKAHLESSTMGSMVLAGVLLKLGAYGLIIFFNLFSMYLLDFNYFVMIYMIYIYLICLNSIDYKSLIAFFSIAHMAVIVSSLIMKMELAYYTVLIFMISHTISSSALFLLVSIYYKYFSSRIFVNNSSMINMGMMMVWMLYFFLCLNMSIPPSLNFFGELYFISMITKISNAMIVFVLLMVLLSGVSSILIVLKSLLSKENKLLYMVTMELSLMFLIKTFLAVSALSIFMLMCI